MSFFCIHCKSEIDSKYKACPFCGEPITDFLRRYLETPLDGKYQILARLGVGGMGEVYKVLHIHLNAIRVVKLMRANIAGEEGAHDRFLREARLATKIQHPNVAALYDFSTLDETSRYMVWEYIEGINLHELIAQRGPLAPRYAAKLAVQALMGLEAIHRAGIVHRDVSPENIMVTRDRADDGADDGAGQERVKIIDLGIAKSSSAEDNKTKTGIFVGKWKYCSPEHLGMLPAGERIDGRADLYSFGIVLYEMLTGVPPFVADTPHGYLMKHASERPKSISETNPAAIAAPELEALIFRALEKDRNKRYASAREFAQALERIAAGLPDTPGAPPPPVPVAAELTDKETATVLSVRQAAPTLPSERTPVLRTLDRVEVEDDVERASARVERTSAREPGRAEARPTWPLYAAAIVLAVIVAGAWMMFRPRPETPAPSPQSIQASTMTATTTVAPAAQEAIPVAQAHLGINAFPWANVTSVRNLDNGQSVDIGTDVVTPAALDLAPGRYEVTLSNGGKPVTRTVALEAGRDETVWVNFGDGASASVPDFGGAQ
ncbi:MAG TPA: serine/threonine-protein kinase [Thermoanaerobaculia bacterium]